MLPQSRCYLCKMWRLRREYLWQIQQFIPSAIYSYIPYSLIPGFALAQQQHSVYNSYLEEGSIWPLQKFNWGYYWYMLGLYIQLPLWHHCGYPALFIYCFDKFLFLFSYGCQKQSLYPTKVGVRSHTSLLPRLHRWNYTVVTKSRKAITLAISS